MDRKKTTDPVKAAYQEAEKDMERDPEVTGNDPADDLDEGELAQKDNSDEEGFDELEKERPAKPAHRAPHPHSGKGSEK